MAAVSMAMMMPVAGAAAHRETLFKPLPMKLSKSTGVKLSSRKLVVRASSMKEKAAAGVTAGFIMASTVVVPAAEAASGVSPSLKNFLLSIAAGGTVLLGITGAIIGVSNFDPVKRN